MPLETNLNELEKRIIEQFQDPIIDGVIRGVVQLALIQAATKVHVDTGAYRDALLSVASSSNVGVTRIGKYEWVVLVAGLPDYAVYQEQGRPPCGKMPPPDKIREWVKRNLKVSSEEVNQVAYAVAKKIQQRGIPAHDTIISSVAAILGEIAGQIKVSGPEFR